MLVTMLMTMLKVVKNGLSLSGICDKILCFRDLCFCVFFYIWLGGDGDGIMDFLLVVVVMVVVVVF